MALAHWIWLACFMAGVLAVALYGLTASGHFPVEARSERLKSGQGALVLWGTLAITVLAALSLLLKSWWILPWYLLVIGGGAMLLFAPMLLQPLPDSFVNGRRGLLMFSAGAALLAGVMWWSA